MKQEVPDATLESFYVGSQDFLRFSRLMAKFTDMDHVQNIEILCQCLAILSDPSLYNRTYNDREKKYFKDLVFIWNTGA